MEYEIIIRPEAEQDMAEAFKWYENNRTGLGFDFLLQVDAGLRFIARNPEASITYKSARIYILKRFPYKIIYIVKTSQIIVLGAIHGSRSPSVLKGKLKGRR